MILSISGKAGHAPSACNGGSAIATTIAAKMPLQNFLILVEGAETRTGWLWRSTMALFIDCLHFNQVLARIVFLGGTRRRVDRCAEQAQQHDIAPDPTRHSPIERNFRRLVAVLLQQHCAVFTRDDYGTGCNAGFGSVGIDGLAGFCGVFSREDS